jgi:hypothetical protein
LIPAVGSSLSFIGSSYTPELHPGIKLAAIDHPAE